jgi:hypothetical protein
VAERNHGNDSAETAVLPEQVRPDHAAARDDATAEAHDRYEEYVRSLDELPLLVDVVHEPTRRPIREFRFGQRPDLRKAPREDAADLRERHDRETAALYAEYVELCAGLAAARRAGPRQAAAKRVRNKGAKKKRAKRAKRSAR